MVKTADDKFLFVDNYQKYTISIISTDPFKEQFIIKSGPKPVGMAISDNDSILWVTNYVSASIYLYKIIR